MASLKLDSVRENIRRALEPYLRRMLDIYSDDIVSIVLYGSATGRDFVSKGSDINLLVVFKRLDFSHLNRALKTISGGLRSKITAPLFLTEEHIRTSKDVFPIEYLEIKENNIVLYGADLFREMEIDKRNIRIFCEQQIKGKLIRMRQSYLETGLRPKGMKALMIESLNGLFPAFRSLLRIKNIKPQAEKEDVLNQLAGTFNLEKSVLAAILEEKKGSRRLPGRDLTGVFERYLGELEKLAAAVDRL